MQELPKETISALFAVREDDAESNSDFSMDFSLDSDPQDWGNYTSTPVKLDDTTNLGSDASSPASFSGPSFSFIEDSDEQQSLHESTTEMTGTQCSCLLSQPQDNSNSSIQPHQISVHYSQPNANLCLNDLQLTSSQPEASVNTQNRPDQISSSCNQPENSANVTSIGSTSTSTTSTLPIARGIKIVGDNVDKMVKTRYMRVDKQGKSLHYFHAYAAQDRFDLTMPEEVPSTPDSPDLNELLPSNYDKSTMKNLFAIHVARILCKYMPFFSEDFSDVIPENLEHPMSSEMSEKSQVVSLHYVYIITNYQGHWGGSYAHACM